MDAAVGRWSRVRGLVVIGCALAVAAALCWPQVPFNRSGYASGVTIHPWWTWVLVAALGAGGAVLVLAPGGSAGRRWRLGAAGVVLVVAAELVGTGIVAAKHWRPAQGMGGYPGRTDTLEQLALLVAAAGLVAVAVAAVELAGGAAFGRPPSRGLAGATIVLGLAIVVVVPVLMVQGDGRDLTSWGAVGLIYAGPWGVSIALSAWLEPTAAAAVRLTVLGGAAVATLGPQMTDLLLADDRGFAVVVIAVAALLVASLRRTPSAP